MCHQDTFSTTRGEISCFKKDNPIGTGDTTNATNIERVNDCKNDKPINSTESKATSISQPTEVLYKRLGHLDIGDVKRLVNKTTGVQFNSEEMPDLCKGGVDGKQTQNVSRSPGIRAKTPIDLFHVN